MTAVERDMSAAFVEIIKDWHIDPKTGELVQSLDYKTPIETNVKRCASKSGIDEYRVTVELAVTDFGDTLYTDGLPKSVTAPDWCDNSFVYTRNIIKAVKKVEIPEREIQKLIPETELVSHTVTSTEPGVRLQATIKSSKQKLIVQLCGSEIIVNMN